MDVKNEKFKRLAKQRGERVLKDIKLISNLSNTNNYSYTDQEVSKVFSAIEEELKIARLQFRRSHKREIKL